MVSLLETLGSFPSLGMLFLTQMLQLCYNLYNKIVCNSSCSSSFKFSASAAQIQSAICMRFVNFFVEEEDCCR